MKRIAITLLLSVAYLPVQANGFRLEMCTNLANSAASTAKNRYAGVQMAHAMTAALALSDALPELEGIVKGAYALPNYSSNKMQVNATKEFSNQIFAECFDNPRYQTKPRKLDQPM